MPRFNWDAECSYNADNKARFHSMGRARLRQLAKEMDLPPGSYDIRSNKAGIAVSGEITLHHERVYVRVSQSCMGNHHGILIRSCKGRKDYTGGMNNFASLAMLEDMPSLAARVLRIMNSGR